MGCIAADMPCFSFPVAQAQPERFILVREKLISLSSCGLEGILPRDGILAVPNVRLSRKTSPPMYLHMLAFECPEELIDRQRCIAEPKHFAEQRRPNGRGQHERTT